MARTKARRATRARRSSSNWLRRQRCWTSSGWHHPARGGLLRLGVHCPARLATVPPSGRDSTRNGRSAFLATPSTRASRGPTSSCVPRWTAPSPEPTCSWQIGSCGSFCPRGDGITARVYQTAAGNPAAETRCRQRWCEPWCCACTITRIDLRFNGWMPSQVKRCPASPRGRRGHFLRGRLPGRRVRGNSVGGGIFRSPRLCSRA